MTSSSAPERPATVRRTPLRQIADRVGAHCSAHCEVTGITNRSGDVLPGDVYVGVPGQRTHGARFASAAVDAGAVAVLTDAAGAALIEETGSFEVPVLVVTDARAAIGPAAALVYGDPSETLVILGITATSGKTTTAYLLRAGLVAAGHTVGLIGTVETVVGDRVIAHSPGGSFTTPEAADLQALLAVMVEAGVTHVVMEVSSHALSLARVGGIGFAVAGFGNLSQDHLDFHRTMTEYLAAKAMLFDGRSARHVVNIDDPAGVQIAAIAPERTVTISPAGAPADWRVAQDPRLGPDGSEFAVVSPGGDPERPLDVAITLPGDFNVANALMAIAMLDGIGVEPRVAVPALRPVAVPGRMERIDAGEPYLAVVDYSHKPAAVSAALYSLREQTAGRLILVLGCGGDRDAAKRPLMGEAGARDADVLILTDDNPRSEDPASIRAQMLAGAESVPAADRAEILEIGDRRGAIERAAEIAQEGDVVLVAGKGHERGQYAAGTVIDFDDRIELRRAIASHS